MNSQVDSTSAAAVSGAVPGTTVTLPSELTKIEPTKVDEATQQGTITHFLNACAPVPWHLPDRCGGRGI